MPRYATSYSAPSRPRPTGARSPTGRAATPVAPGVNPLRWPRRASALVRHSLAPLREQAFATWLDARRSAVAALLLWGLDQGVLDDADVHAALDRPHPHERLYELFCATLDALPDVIEALACRHALAEAVWPDWNAWVEIDLIEYYGEACGLQLTARGCWLHRFHLDRLPPGLAVAIAHTLEWIEADLTDCCLLRDLAELWRDEALGVFEELRATGLTDMDALWAHVQDHTSFDQWFGWADLENFAQWWRSLASFCDPELPWIRRWLAQRGRWQTPATRRRRLLRRLWRGRRDPALRRDPWFRWLRRAVLTLCRSARRGSKAGSGRWRGDEDSDDDPLAYTQPLAFGEPWEADFLDDYDQFLGHAEGFARRWPCRVADWENLRDGLTAFAIGQGLLIGAAQADETTFFQPENGL